MREGRLVASEGVCLSAGTPQPLNLQGGRASKGQWERTQEVGISDGVMSLGNSQGTKLPLMEEKFREGRDRVVA